MSFHRPVREGDGYGGWVCMSGLPVGEPAPLSRFIPPRGNLSPLRGAFPVGVHVGDLKPGDDDPHHRHRGS